MTNDFFGIAQSTDHPEEAYLLAKWLSDVYEQTSPTNIAMYALSLVGAVDAWGYVK